MVQVWREIGQRKDPAVAGITETQVAVALSRVDLVWDQLFPLEQHRIVQLLVERIVVSPGELQVKLRPNGVETLDVIRKPGLPRKAQLTEDASA